MFLCVETCRNPFEVPQEPTVLNDSSANLTTFACGTVQEPIVGVKMQAWCGNGSRLKVSSA